MSPGPRLLAPPVCLLVLLTGAPTPAAELPTIEGVRAVAAVNGQPIALADLEREIALLHAAPAMGDRPMGRQNPTALLDRLITAKLVVQEARNIGLDELPEAAAAFERHRTDVLREMTIARATGSVSAPDPKVLDRVYKNLVREYRVRSILISKEADAKYAAERLKAGVDFDKLADEMVKAKKAQEGDSKAFMKQDEMLPAVRTELARLKLREVSAVLGLQQGWAVFRLLETRHPENAAAREQARQTALEETRIQALDTYMEGLRARYAAVDRKLLAALDFDQPGGLARLAQDRRPVAQVKGEAPVTVADLTAAMERRFYHGADKAAAAKRINAEKARVLDDVLDRRAVAAEARRLGLESSPEYVSRVARKDEAWLFGAFAERAIAPDVKVEENDLKAYYDAHKTQYMGPEMVRIDAIPYATRKEAEDALAKLKRGADFAFLKKNAPRVAIPTDEALSVAPGLVVTTSLPETVQSALAGAAEGDVRLHPGTGASYVLKVLTRRAATPAGYEAMRETVRKQVQMDRFGKALEEWGSKLRKASDVKVFATGEALRDLVLKDLAAGRP